MAEPPLRPDPTNPYLAALEHAPSTPPTTTPRRDIPPGPSAWTDALVTVPSFLLTVVTVSWFANLGGSGAGSVLVAIGQLTGLWASVLALITVALMARVPIITHGLGTDRALRWHRWVATGTMVALTLHVFATVLGYAYAGGTSFAHETADLVTTYPDMLTATVGTVLLVAVSVSSIRAIRRRFKYQTWLFVHWYSYLAVALAFGHELSTGASFLSSSASALAWTWLHLFVLGLVVWYRVLLPLARMARHRLVITDVRPEGGNTVSLTFTGRRLDRYAAEAGQHVRVRFLTRDGWWQSHPLSFSAAPTPTEWRLTVVANGDHTSALQRFRPGTRAVVSGVYGGLTAGARVSDRVALFGGGSGIVPMRSLLEAFPPTVDTRVVYRAHAADEVILHAELDWFAQRDGGRVEYLVGPRNPDPRHDVLSAGALHHLIPDLATRDAYVCGTTSFVSAVTASLRTLGVPPTHIHTEQFDG